MRRLVLAVLMLGLWSSPAWAQGQPTQFTATFQAPADQIWTAVLDVLSTTERILPMSRGTYPGVLSFSQLYRVRAIARDVGFIALDTVTFGQTTRSSIFASRSSVDLNKVLGNGPGTFCSGLDRITTVKCGISLVYAVRITPSMRMITQQDVTEIRLSFVIEYLYSDFFVGDTWHYGTSNGALEQATFAAIRSRLASTPAAAPTPTVTPSPAATSTPAAVPTPEP